MTLERIIEQEIDGKVIQIINVFSSSEVCSAHYSFVKEQDGFKVSGTINLKNDIAIPFELYQPTNSLLEAKEMTTKIIENAAKEFGAII